MPPDILIIDLTVLRSSSHLSSPRISATNIYSVGESETQQFFFNLFTYLIYLHQYLLMPKYISLWHQHTSCCYGRKKQSRNRVYQQFYFAYQPDSVTHLD